MIFGYITLFFQNYLILCNPLYKPTLSSWRVPGELWGAPEELPRISRGDPWEFVGGSESIRQRFWCVSDWGCPTMSFGSLGMPQEGSKEGASIEAPEHVARPHEARVSTGRTTVWLHRLPCSWISSIVAVDYASWGLQRGSDFVTQFYFFKIIAHCVMCNGYTTLFFGN